MAVLSSAQRQAIRKAWCELLSQRREAFPLIRADLDAAINATDNWIDSNAISFNNALPTAAKNNLSAAQKAELFSFVALKRYSG